MTASMMRHGSSDAPNETPAKRTLAEQLARGEIEVEEYRRLRDALHRASGPTADAENFSRSDRHPSNA